MRSYEQSRVEEAERLLRQYQVPPSLSGWWVVWPAQPAGSSLRATREAGKQEGTRRAPCTIGRCSPTPPRSSSPPNPQYKHPGDMQAQERLGGALTPPQPGGPPAFGGPALGGSAIPGDSGRPPRPQLERRTPVPPGGF